MVVQPMIEMVWGDRQRLVCIQKDSMAETDTPVDRAAKSVQMAVADFAVAIFEAKTTRAALIIRRQINELILSLGAMESAALEKADRLC